MAKCRRCRRGPLHGEVDWCLLRVMSVIKPVVRLPIASVAIGASAGE
jgi:hypothetical protein